MNKVFLFLLIIVSIFQSCKKKNEEPKTSVAGSIIAKTYDTIKPLPYFPAYPGSYWNYLDDKNQIITYTTSPTYKKSSYSLYSSDSPPKIYFTHDTVYVPFYMELPVWGYKFVITPIVSETLGDIWVVGFANHDESLELLETKDTTIVINGFSYYPTIVVFGYTHHTTSGYDYPAYRKYFTKNIGLIKYESINGTKANSIVTYKYELSSYFINK